jgi:hypothetical protein
MGMRMVVREVINAVAPRTNPSVLICEWHYVSER